ncbi:hypothetical protein [Limnohabitans sp.]|uniref:hypothetical protein n=1 Tax=Limnohabitans sp. TaxID=1907725 RepID=UPI00286EF7A5|nr:hypothetical protein [Limnohabitans sp.]
MADINPTNNNLVIDEGITFKGSIFTLGKAVINGNVIGELAAALVDSQHGQSARHLELPRFGDLTRR